MKLEWTTADNIQRSVNCHQVIYCDFYGSGDQARLEIFTQKCGFVLHGQVAIHLWNKWLNYQG